MTRDDAPRFAELFTAWHTGKTLQFFNDGEWNDLGFEAEFCYPAHRYRIKPEPREWWLRSHNGNDPCAGCGFYSSLESAQRPAADSMSTKRIIHVREVLE